MSEWVVAEMWDGGSSEGEWYVEVEEWVKKGRGKKRKSKAMYAVAWPCSSRPRRRRRPTPFDGVIHDVGLHNFLEVVHQVVHPFCNTRFFQKFSNDFASDRSVLVLDGLLFPPRLGR